NVARFSPVPAVAALACARAPCAIAIAGWWWGSGRLHALDRSVLLARVGTAERALVETEEPPRVGRFGIRVRVLVLRWGETRPHEPVLLELPGGRAPPQGSRLSLVGVLKLPRGPSPGFDEATSLRRQGIHCLAVDGLKVGTVAAGALALMRLLGIGRIAAELAALAAVGAYTLAVGFHPSVVRAAVAAALGSLAWLSARERDRWHALLLGALALLAWNPAFVLDAGFQLSFAAVAAIFVVTPRVVR